MKKLLFGCITAVAALIALVGCEQDKVVYSGPNYLMFSDTLYQYGVQESNEIFNVPVSATVPADYDRTFAVEILDKKSNAVEGKHYKLLSNTVTIKAGEMAANVEVQGNYESIEPTDSLGFALHLIIPESNEWEMLYCRKFVRSTSTTLQDTVRLLLLSLAVTTYPIKMWICV